MRITSNEGVEKPQRDDLMFKTATGSRAKGQL